MIYLDFNLNDGSLSIRLCVRLYSSIKKVFYAFILASLINWNLLARKNKSTKYSSLLSSVFLFTVSIVPTIVAIILFLFYVCFTRLFFTSSLCVCMFMANSKHREQIRIFFFISMPKFFFLSKKKKRKRIHLIFYFTNEFYFIGFEKLYGIANSKFRILQFFSGVDFALSHSHTVGCTKYRNIFIITVCLSVFSLSISVSLSKKNPKENQRLKINEMKKKRDRKIRKKKSQENGQNFFLIK